MIPDPLNVSQVLTTPFTNLVQPLTIVGDGTGDAKMDDDYSSTADDFFIKPGASEVFRVSAVIVTMMIPGTDALSLLGYGGSDTVLTNGLKFIHSQNSVETTLFTVKRNLALISASLPIVGTGGKGGSSATFLTARILFPQSVRLDGAAATPDQFIIRVNDDLTQFGGNDHEAFVTGFIE